MIKVLEQFYNYLYSTTLQNPTMERKNILKIRSEEISEITQIELEMAISQIPNQMMKQPLNSLKKQGISFGT